jgi:hypothetical protein
MNFLEASYSQGIPKSKLPTKIGSTNMLAPPTFHNQLFAYIQNNTTHVK